ncbi:hypothetical protein MGYG_07531 [Nannizzia gypsea CBS 118893]|uniref:Uncharacterized protein n=1 Tax=Arthroderma gypseum (strain ATCC MYA-4604 / CBS 118893) TaxID=535722 RepID=E4V3F1_ARTGP|nr:hypothetical protein MGYG_07531 [Nannizzia gypsea CBS 118893]EFR04525.1 hypothetical protein MGYG_07531 [Nannizzia gypsea CBS 118893]
MSLSDKQNNSMAGKPFVPQVGSAYRNTKTPLTPKLAGFNSHLPRKLAHFDSPSPNNNRTPDVSTPKPSAINNANITPRSSQRKARKDGNPSPAATTPPPGHLAPRLASQRSSRSNPNEVSPTPHEQHTSLNLRVSRAKSMSNEPFGYLPNNRPASSCGSSVGTPMFFHADDARSPTSSAYDTESKPQPQSTLHLAPKSFIYADGRTEDPTDSAEPSYKQQPPVKKPVLAQSTPIKSPELFVSPRLQETSPSGPQLKQFTGNATEQHIFSPKLVPAQEKAFPQIPNNTGRNDQTPGNSVRFGHMKSTSCDSTHTVGRKHSFLASPLIHRPALTQDSAPQPADDSIDQSPRVSHNPSHSSEDISQHLLPRAPSPSKDDGNGNELQRMNELAANARRERKVLDLEISNSSLLAINRALEREMRKQNAELRRFRRLSRSGRLSMTSTRRSVSGGGLSILSEADGDDTDSYSHFRTSPGYSADELTDDEIDPSSSEEDNMSSGHAAEHDEKHRAKDESRLLLDLKRHQQLLIDSQKMNQSIKRCLGWTENLISEAKKALEYSVHVSDVEVGGRVLGPDDFDGDYFKNTRGLLSPSMDISCSDIPSFEEHGALESPPSIPDRDTSRSPSPIGET